MIEEKVFQARFAALGGEVGLEVVEARPITLTQRIAVSGEHSGAEQLVGLEYSSNGVKDALVVDADLDEHLARGGDAAFRVSLSCLDDLVAPRQTSCHRSLCRRSVRGAASWLSCTEGILTTPPPSVVSVERRSSLTFRTAAGDELLAALDGEAGSTCAVDRNLTLQFVNRAWHEFARANHGETCIANYGIGRSMRDAIPGVLLAFYDEAFAKAFTFDSPWEHLYPCSTSTKQRSYRMRALRLHDGSHLIVSNELVHEADESHGEVALAANYIDSHGFLRQCANCRRCRRVGTATWDWVPAYVAEPVALVSHGLCPTCLALHYPA